METKKIMTIGPIGIHASPARAIVNATSKYASQIEFIYNGILANARSIINLWAFGRRKNDELEIIEDGSDAEEVINTLVEDMKKEKLI